ncbi:hypothetical protein ACN38_g10028 [Penicillium nordicum]|uniref:Uncharacterized protein n=1 Tax=Penicillium nordicum TaxID=229535 RepID=A0A0M9WC11_9EURO|nr:hypothetical protein ACN38_g10028 [Penicillium nordicum]
MSYFIDEHSTSTLVDHPPNPNHPISETFPELHLKRSFFFLSPFSSDAFVRYKPSSFFPSSCSAHLPAMNHYRKFLFINVYHLSTISIHVF